MDWRIPILFRIVFLISAVYSYELKLTSNSPVISGAVVNFRAEFYIDGKPAEPSYRFTWTDSIYPSHERTTKYDLSVDTWNVTYINTKPGQYEVKVTVSEKWAVFDYPIITEFLNFNISEQLNGEFIFTQSNKTVGNFVSNGQKVTHKVELKPSDMNFLKNQSMSALTYWFVDCEYHGVTGDLEYEKLYKVVDRVHQIEALVVGGYEPITTTTVPTTTTTAAQTTTSKPTTTAPTTSTAPNPTSVSSTETHSNEIKRRRRRRSVDNREIEIYDKSMLVSSNRKIGNVSFVCNDTIFPTTGSIYGYFRRNITVKAPVSNFTVTGNLWVLQGDLLELNVKCDGSQLFQYCLKYFPHTYNITGNETCSNPTTTDFCQFSILRYYVAPGPHTIVIIISNDVGKLVSPVTVTVYEVKKHAQLLVIVFPVTFSLLAIVLIIFGVSYHIQNRRRYTVEVADFNFGPQYADYMTFRERLRESIMNTFTRTSVPTEDSSSGPLWPPNQKYGSMPRF